MGKFYIYVFLLFCCNAKAQQAMVKNNLHVSPGGNMCFFNGVLNTTDTIFNNGSLLFCEGDLLNDQPIVGEGTIEFNGKVDQSVLLGGDVLADTLIINNTGGMVLFDNNIVVNRQLVFISGVLSDLYPFDTHPRDLRHITFAPGASHSGASDSSHIEGLVRKMGDADFVFPIGDEGYYRPAYIKNIDRVTSVCAKYYYHQISSQLKPENNVALYRNEYWFINDELGEANAEIGLTYDARTSDFDVDEELLKVTSYNEYESIFQLSKIINRHTSMVPESDVESISINIGTYGWHALSRLIHTNNIWANQLVTPNGDNKNDYFVIKGLEEGALLKVQIFNRYGTVVYEDDNYNNNWGGKANKNTISSNNGLLPGGTYYVLVFNHGQLIYKDFIQLVYES